MVDREIFICTVLPFLLNVSTSLFLLDQGLELDPVSGVTVLENVNGKQYLLSNVQLPYLSSPAFCAAINAIPALLDTNADFTALATRLQLDELLKYVAIWVNITQVGLGQDTRYFWEKEEVDRSLWWSGEPNKQGAGENLHECDPISDTCRPVQMTRVRSSQISNTHYLMDTCCIYLKYFICEDIDECNSTSTFTCPTNSYCSNTPGSYTCLCNKGYKKKNAVCEDIDECNSMDTFTCPTNSNCSNTPGSYACICNQGYKMNKAVCEDIDECNSTGTFTCPTNSKCSNTPGSYACFCNKGYKKNNGVCEDIDECNSTGTFTCPTNSNCSNTHGSYTCLCNEGYQKNNGVCEDFSSPDIDECKSTHTFTCPTNSNCSNTPGSYACLCNEGYQKNNGVCEDIDECNSTGTFTCPTNSNCSNTPGSYACFCNQGYTMNNTVCEDLDECSNRTDVCPPSSNCVNTVASFHCQEGLLSANNTTCQDVADPLVVIMASNADTVRLGTTVVLLCQALDDNFTQLSSKVYHWLKDGVHLPNSDASLELHNITKEDEGGFQCCITDGVSLEPSLSIPFMLTVIADNSVVSDQTTIKCPCRCHWYPVYNITQGPTVDISGQYIQVDRLSSRIRARTSAIDPRVAAVVTGSTAVAVLLCLLLVTAAVDVVPYVC